MNRYSPHHDPQPPHHVVASATAPGLRWTRWRSETDTEFRQRVRAEAAALGLTPRFPTPFHDDGSGDDG